MVIVDETTADQLRQFCAVCGKGVIHCQQPALSLILDNERRLQLLPPIDLSVIISSSVTAFVATSEYEAKVNETTNGDDKNDSALAKSDSMTPNPIGQLPRSPFFSVNNILRFE